MDTCILNFLDAIKFYIAENNMTPTSFARELHVKDACVARWLHGINTPSSEYVVIVADFLNTSVDYLFGLKEDPAFLPAVPRRTFAERFALLQQNSTVSMNTLAKLCEVTSSNVSKWMRGQMPKPTVLCFLAEHFACSVDFLLGRSDI